MGVKVTMHLKKPHINKFSLGFGKELNLYTANTVMKRCDKYVPFRTGRLATDVEVDADNKKGIVHYVQGYAYYPYKPTYDDMFGVGNWKYTRKFHPLAHEQWDKEMLKNERDLLDRDIEKKRRELADEKK